MNSLYGKFCMTDDLGNHVIVNTDKISTVELNDDLYLVSYHDIDENKFIDDSTNSDISVSVASAITAYSRFIMTLFKNLPDNQMYYTETDSAVMEKSIR